MARLVLLPLAAFALLVLVAGRFAAVQLPPQIVGVPTPMILFIVLGAFVLSLLRTI